MAKDYKPFFVTDSTGKLFKAVPVNDEDVPVEEDEKKEKEKVIVKPEDKVAAKDDVLGSLSEDDIAILKEMIAAHKAAKQQTPSNEAEDGCHDEGTEVEKEINELEKEKVIDTVHDSVKNGFGSVQTKAKPKDSVDTLDVDRAWAKRYEGKN